MKIDNEKNCDENCEDCIEVNQAKISPIMVMGSENKGILNATTFILKLFQRDEDEKYEKKLKEMVDQFSQIVRHYKKKEELFLPLYSSLGFERQAEFHVQKDKEILQMLQELQEKNVKLSPYQFKAIYLEFCKKLVELVKEENTNLYVYCLHNFTQDEMDDIGRKIPSYDYTFLAIKPKDEDLVSQNCKDKILKRGK